MIEINGLQQILVGAVGIVLPLVTGIVEIIKRTTNVDERFLPLTSVIVGIALGLFIIDLSVTGGVAGLIIGLGATGLWEFGKTTVAGR